MTSQRMVAGQLTAAIVGGAWAVAPLCLCLLPCDLNRQPGVARWEGNAREGSINDTSSSPLFLPEPPRFGTITAEMRDYVCGTVLFRSVEAAVLRRNLTPRSALTPVVFLEIKCRSKRSLAAGSGGGSLVCVDVESRFILVPRLGGGDLKYYEGKKLRKTPNLGSLGFTCGQQGLDFNCTRWPIWPSSWKCGGVAHVCVCVCLRGQPK